MKKELTLIEWKEKFLNGDFRKTDSQTQCQAGWYDWFCKDSSLAKKTEFLGKRLLQLLSSPLVDCKNHYVFFKNNCPCVGPKYDDFRICDIETGNVLFCLSNVKKGCYGDSFSGWEIWDFSKEGEGSNKTHDAVLKGSWKEVKEYFKVA